MQLGFIGTGALTSAIVTGLKSVADNPVSVFLSPRNTEIAAGLAARYPDVSVAASNQAVLDNCDTIMLAVRPQIAPEVLKELRFERRHHVVSLIATLSREEVAAMISVKHVTKALPMPMIAHGQGATIIYPSDPEIAALFGGLGKAIEVGDANEFDALSVATATYAAYFTYLDTIHRWLKTHGVEESKGRDYIATLFKALANAPEAAPNTGFARLAGEYATRGGINEQVLRQLTERRVFDAFEESLDAVLERVSGSAEAGRHAQEDMQCRSTISKS